MALDRWAVVTRVMPPARGPSSRTTTALPACVSWYAVVRPAMPAPTTQTSARASSSSEGQSGILAVAAQTDRSVAGSVFGSLFILVASRGRVGVSYAEGLVQLVSHFFSGAAGPASRPGTSRPPPAQVLTRRCQWALTTRRLRPGGEGTADQNGLGRAAGGPSQGGLLMGTKRKTGQRSTGEVFEDHLARRRAGDVEGDLALNYDDDVVLLTGFGVFRGKDGVRRNLGRLLEGLPCIRYEYGTRLVEGEVAFLEWSARGPTAVVEDGANSFLIRGGRIVVQTIHYTVRPRKSSKTPGKSPRHRHGGSPR